ncbi:hypothetical protein Tco_1467149 [Tanacetum coccineum]
MNTKFAKSSILGKPVLQPHRNQSVVRQPTEFKSERPRISKPRFASQVDVNNDLSKPVTTYYLPKEREVSSAKLHHMIAHGSSRYNSNYMVHNHYLEEAKKQTQEIGRNSKTSVIPSVRSQSTANGSKPKHRWKLTGKFFKTVGLRWVTTGKIFNSSTTKVDSEPPNGSNENITNPYECEQTLDVSVEKKDTLSSYLESEEQQMQLIQDKSKESCMVSFQRLHSHLKRLSNNDLKGSRTENGFGRAFATLFGQDFEIFTGTMFLNMDQLQKQLDNNEFQDIGSMASFKVLETQFQMFIKLKIYLNDEYIVMTRNYFLQYTQLDIPKFCETLVQFMEYVKKSINERALHKREHDRRVNERQTQKTMEKVDTSKELDASSVIIESNGTESQKQDTSSRSRNDADIRPIHDEEPMAKVQMTADENVSATGQQHTEQPESNNEGEVDQNAEQCHDTCPLPAKLTDNKTIELSN